MDCNQWIVEQEEEHYQHSPGEAWYSGSLWEVLPNFKNTNNEKNNKNNKISKKSLTQHFDVKVTKYIKFKLNIWSET